MEKEEILTKIEEEKNLLDLSENDAERFQHLLELGRLYLKLFSAEPKKEHLDSAEEFLRKAEKIEATPNVLSNLGVIAYMQQRFDKAAEFFQRVVTEHDLETYEDKRPFAVSYYLLGKIALAINKPENAIRYFHLASKVQPNDPAIYNDLGIAYMRNREIENAKQSFQKALEIDPNYRLAKKNLEIVETE